MLSGSATPDLDAANQRLAGLVSHTPPVGENYRLVKLGGTPAAYAMVVNFGLGGPAAVRIYAAADGRYVLASRIDHFLQKDFFDSDIELIPVSDAEPVFVTVSGRTDDLSTGMFSAWRFDGRRVVPLWSSDLLQQSNYEADANGFHLTYCGQPDEDHPAQCLKMTRDLYRFQDGEWKRIETANDRLWQGPRQNDSLGSPRGSPTGVAKSVLFLTLSDIPSPEIPIKMLIWSYFLARERDGIA